MHDRHRGKGIWLGLALGTLVAGWGPLGCGSEESKMDRGLVVDQEEAVPGSADEFDMTEAERRAKEERETERKEAKQFEETQQ